jgi:hypothetical protein
MSLMVYSNLEDVKKSGKTLVRLNDLYFDTETTLSDDNITSIILKTVDKASYNSKQTFRGRDESLGALNKSMLSTGTKTLLNILEHPDVCFDVCECGNNALCLLPLIKNGNIYWKVPVAVYDKNIDCDIQYEGSHYTDFDSFIESVGD